MTDINKQKFLAELGKLLTFMYEEDRQQALAMYSRMFDQAADEQALLQFLVSPTRQAVVIARAYNARERKLQVNSQSREKTSGEVSPDFARAIEALENEALSRGIITPEVPAEQFTLFSDGIHPVDETAESTADEASSAADVPKAEDSPAETSDSVPAEINAADTFPVEETAKPDAEEAGSVAADSVMSSDIAEGSAETEAASSESAAAENAAAAAQTETPASDDAEVDAFLSEFSIAGDGLETPADKEAGADTAASAVPSVPTAPAQESAAKAAAENDMRGKREQAADAVDLTVRKPIVPLLVLYIIIAVPVVALCVLILLVPTLLSLALAGSSVMLGCTALTTAFGSFTIFADVMVVLGAALLGLALGLLFLWIFIWFIGGAIAGLINAVIKLGGKWCYKEVSAA